MMDATTNIAVSMEYLLRHEPNTRNWCPQFRNHVSQSLSLDTCAYMASIEPSPRSAHYHCTRERCSSIVETTEPHHCGVGCHCELLGPDIKHVKDLVLAHKIPLLRIRRSSNGSLTIKVEEATFDSRYIAVSHVWTGGLGNPRQNCLPRCQLGKIASSGKQIREVIESTRHPSFPRLFASLYRKFVTGDIDLFWIDTLCIPVREYRDVSETPESEEIRGAAIDRMTQIYAGSHSVYVIDPELRILPNNLVKQDPRRLAAHIFRCDWMRRCWTYQEGAMGRRLFVMLESGPMYLTREFFHILNGDNNGVHETALDPEARRHQTQLKELTSWLSDLPAPRHTYEYDSRRLISGSGPKAFAIVWNSLLARTTLREEDRYLILALMTNLVPSPLIGRDKIKPDEKLRSIFNSLSIIPQDFLYDMTPTVNGYWLPKTMEGRLSYTGGHLVRESIEKYEFELAHLQRGETDDTSALYILPLGPLSGRYFSVSVPNGNLGFQILSPAEVGRIYESHESILLLVKDYRTLSFSTTMAALFKMTSREAPNEWQLERICGARCIAADPSQRDDSFSLGMNMLDESRDKFFISCDFRGASRLQRHRDPSDHDYPGRTIAVPQFLHLHSHINCFYILYIAIVAIVALTPNPAHFPVGWVIFIVEFCAGQAAIQILLINRYLRQGDQISHMAWLDDLTPEWPPALPKRLRAMTNVNYGPIETCTRLLIGAVLTGLGIGYWQDPDVRWLIALGVLLERKTPRKPRDYSRILPRVSNDDLVQAFLWMAR
ncbi:hypothetical protein GGR51DRAFT_534399 [Nemania sp. FL0031]|nr:hypothetical protein GGR51DRAFT_534399 [Nemania sp. FL0031]